MRNSTGQSRAVRRLQASAVRLLFSFPGLIGFLRRFLWVLISHRVCAYGATERNNPREINS